MSKELLLLKIIKEIGSVFYPQISPPKGLTSLGFVAAIGCCN